MIMENENDLLKYYDSHEGMGAACYAVATICLVLLAGLGVTLYVALC